MKTILSIAFLCLTLPACAQSAADVPASPVIGSAEHNFFNWKNSLVFGVQAGGIVWYAKERNGTLSNVTSLAYWQRAQYLKNAYLQGTFFALAADGAAYAIHKSGQGWKRHLAEHLLVDGAAAGLYVFANRNRHEYNTQECRFGEKEFCR